MIRKLSELEPGETGVVHSFGSNDLFLKLMEMGCVPGEQLMVEMRAPLGDPISIMVAGYHLSLRINEAEQILVETLSHHIA
jgi:Fe2+ transport system protein FeoA